MIIILGGKNTSNRLFYLDNLKLFTLIFLVICHHAIIPYIAYPDKAWTYFRPLFLTEFMPNGWRLTSINTALNMPLFFFISGYFVPRSYDKCGFVTFLKKKLIRLGIPLLVVSVIASFLLHGFQLGHAWFLESLLLFCMIYSLLCNYTDYSIKKQKDSEPTILLLLILSLGVGFGSWAICKVYEPEQWANLLGFIQCTPTQYLQYITMFVMGIVSYRLHWLQNLSDRFGAISFIITGLLALGICLIPYSVYSSHRHLYAIYQSFLCVFGCFGLTWTFKKFLNGTNKFLKWCSEQSYGAYIFHTPILIIFEYATAQLYMNVYLKWLIICILTVCCSFIFTWALKLIPKVNKVL